MQHMKSMCVKVDPPVLIGLLGTVSDPVFCVRQLAVYEQG